MAQQIIILDKPAKKPPEPKKKPPPKKAPPPRAAKPPPKKPPPPPPRRPSPKRSTSRPRSSAPKKPPAAQPTRKGSEECFTAPAPNTYKLKTLVGYQDHDVSKWREPAFSMGKRNPGDKGGVGPGPKYDIGDVTRFGPKNPLMFSLGRKGGGPDKKEMPGPTAYAPEKFIDPRFKRAPSASIKSRLKDAKLGQMPSPADYEAPGGMGKTHPTIPASPSAVLMSRRAGIKKNIGPGPNTYGSPNVEVTKKTAPMASLGSRAPAEKPPKGPGPGAYNPQANNGKSPPAFSFGTKRSKCITPYKEPDSLENLTIC